MTERKRLAQKKWRQQHPELEKQYNCTALLRKRKWAREKYNRCRIQMRRIANAARWRVKEEVFAHYFGANPKCRCGARDLRVLSMHHINGDGKKQRQQLFGHKGSAGMNFYQKLKKHGFPTDYKFELLCSNCHLIAEFEKATGGINPTASGTTSGTTVAPQWHHELSLLL